MPYVRVVAEHNIVSDAIRLTGDLFSHIGFRLDDETWLDCRFSLDKDKDGVRIRPADSLHDFRHVDFTFDGIEQAIAFGRTLIGTHYDLSDIAGFVFDPALHDPNKLICSRFVQECSENTGKMPLLGPWVKAWHVRPAHFPFSPVIKILDVYPKNLQL